MPKEISLDKIKEMPLEHLNKLIIIAKKKLKKDPIMIDIFKEYDVNIDELDYIPTAFKDLDVSAKTDHCVVYLNYKLLADGDFLKDYSYIIHEYTHYLQQSTGKNPTKGSKDGEYLDNKAEQEAFKNQVEYIASYYGEEEAEDYVDNLLEHHDIEDEEVEDKKDLLMSQV